MTPLPSPLWYAAHVAPKCEFKVASRLKGCGWWTFLPFDRYRVKSKRQERQGFGGRWVERPRYPRYLFVSLRYEGEVLPAISSFDGLLEFLGFYDIDDRGNPRHNPVAIPGSVMDVLMAMADDEGHVLTVDTLAKAKRELLAIGERVRISGGLLASDFVHTVIEDCGKRTVKVEVEGKKVDVPFGDLEKVA